MRAGTCSSGIRTYPPFESSIQIPEVMGREETYGGGVVLVSVDGIAPPNLLREEQENSEFSSKKERGGGDFSPPPLSSTVSLPSIIGKVRLLSSGAASTREGTPSANFTSPFSRGPSLLG